MIPMEVLEARLSARLRVQATHACSSSSARSTSRLTLQREVVMYTRHSMVLALLAAGLLPGQDAQPSILVTGAVKQPLTLSAGDLAKMPRVSVHATRDGMETVYEGVWLHEVLKKAGVPQGNELRGKALASYVLAEAQDGYQ